MFSKSPRRYWGTAIFRSLTINFEFAPSRIPLSPPCFLRSGSPHPSKGAKGGHPPLIVSLRTHFSAKRLVFADIRRTIISNHLSRRSLPPERPVLMGFLIGKGR